MSEVPLYMKRSGGLKLRAVLGFGVQGLGKLARFHRSVPPAGVGFRVSGAYGLGRAMDISHNSRGGKYRVTSLIRNTPS